MTSGSLPSPALRYTVAMKLHGNRFRRLSAFVLVALLAASASWAGERLLVGGVVHTPDGAERLEVLIRDGRIARLVQPEDVEGEAWTGVERVDLGGAHVLPGLIDAHLHVTSFGAALEQVDLNGAASYEEVVRRAGERAGELPAGAWLEGRGWDQNLWPEPVFPDRQALDEAVPDKPALLRRVDGHAALANSAALRLAGIDADTADPPGGRILRRADGTPSGVLIDEAIGLVREVVPRPTAADIERRILRSTEALAAFGLTQVMDAGTTAAELAVMRRLEKDGLLPIRVYVLLDGEDDELLDQELERGPVRRPGAMLRIGGVKLYADGALGSRGALLGADYTDEPGNRGLAVTSLGRLRSVIFRASAMGFQVGVHAIGDEGVHRTLNVFEALSEKHRRRLRHRIEHSQIVRPEDVERFAKLGVVASVQPTHCTSDMPWAPDRIGPDRTPWAYRWRSLQRAGVALAGGSDAPVESPDPRLGLYAARTRQRPDGTPAQGWNPGERLTPTGALDLFTTWAATANHAGTWCGQIRPGFVADLTVVDGDPIEGDPASLLGLKVLRTVVGGEDRFVAEGIGGS